MQRVMICGGPGSGKSTLARALGTRSGLPVYHMDHIHWMPGWTPRPSAAKLPLVQDIIARDRWIFEGGHSSSYAARLARADTFIWLDLPVGLRFRRILWRTLRNYGKTRPDMAPNCREGFHSETLAFWRFIWATRHSSREKLAQLMAGATGTQTFHLTSPSQVAAFLANLPSKQEAPA